MKNYLVIASVTCPLPDADIFFNEQPFKFGTIEQAGTYQDAETIRDDMTKWCNRDHIVIYSREEVEAIVKRGVQ